MEYWHFERAPKTFISFIRAKAFAQRCSRSHAFVNGRQRTSRNHFTPENRAASVQTLIRPSRSPIDSIDFLSVPDDIYRRYKRRATSSLVLPFFKSLSTLIFENKCMIRFADPPTAMKRGFIRWQEKHHQQQQRQRRLDPENKGLFPRQLWLKRKRKKRKNYFSHLLIVSHVPHIIITTTVLVKVMLKSYLRLTKKNFSSQKRAQTLLCCRCRCSPPEKNKENKK